MTKPEKTRTFHSSSDAATIELGAGIGRRIQGGMCIALTGSLGAGKSMLIRGICRGLNIEEDVLSPTFILFEEYQGRLPVVHLDLYRLEHEREIEELGVFERLDESTLVLVEWGDRSARVLDAADVLIHLEITGPAARRITARYPAQLAPVFEETETIEGFETIGEIERTGGAEGLDEADEFET